MVLRWLRPRQPHGWHGDFPSWESAMSEAGGSGYADPMIVRQIESSAGKVLAGRAAFERDGVAFDEPEARWPCLACLLQIHSRCGRLRVLDIGGSLATFWVQHRAWLPMAGMRWCVVEQPGFVAAGIRLFPDGPPEFRDDLGATLADGPWDVAVISNALQYMHEPECVLARIAESGTKYLLLDSLAITSRDHDRFTVQRVPEHVYRATYACRFFSEARIDSLLAEHWLETARWQAATDVIGVEGCRLVGRLLTRKA